MSLSTWMVKKLILFLQKNNRNAQWKKNEGFISSHHIYMECSLDLLRVSGWNGKRGGRATIERDYSYLTVWNYIWKFHQKSAKNCFFKHNSFFWNTLMHKIVKKFIVSTSRSPRKNSSHVVHQLKEKIQSFLRNSLSSLFMLDFIILHTRYFA